MKASREILEGLIGSTLTPALEKLGFHPGKKHWFVRCDDKTCQKLVVSVTANRGEDSVWCTIVGHVGFPILARFMQPFFNIQASEVKCPTVMAANLGSLIPLSARHKWLITPNSDADEIGREIFGEILKYFNPFFTEFSDLPSSLDRWKRGRTYNMAGTALGYTAAAIALSGDLQSALHFIDDRIREIRSNIERFDRSYDKRELCEAQRLRLFVESRFTSVSSAH